MVGKRSKDYALVMDQVCSWREHILGEIFYIREHILYGIWSKDYALRSCRTKVCSLFVALGFRV
jgi:hypothetical protein